VAEVPSGTVTFLFTDIEGSTRLWQEQPDAMRPALARHDEILRAAIEANDGFVVKTTGDGVHAAFPTASAAIAAAVDAQLAFGGEAWPLPAPLRVRMGLHSGPSELRDGDYYGTVVNRAARLMSVAHGGRIVVSLATSELVRDSDVELFDLGEHRLRDLTGAERVNEVRAPGPASGFPPLRSVDAFPGNLPRQLTSFVGRDQEPTGTLISVRPSGSATGGVSAANDSPHSAPKVLPWIPTPPSPTPSPTSLTPTTEPQRADEPRVPFPP
jgi:class 3 adenylate cyclase